MSDGRQLEMRRADLGQQPFDAPQLWSVLGMLDGHFA